MDVAIVTGAAGLLGFHHCMALLQTGISVVAIDIDQGGLDRLSSRLEEYHDTLFPLKVDLLCDESIEHLFQYTSEFPRPIRYLVNNAASNPTMIGIDSDSLGLLKSFERQQFLRECDLGLAAVVKLSCFYGEKMAESGGGAIINIASDLSVISPDQRIYQSDEKNTDWESAKPISYSVIKHGLVGITKYIATYWPNKNVRCNALSPGGIFCDQSNNLVDQLAYRIPLGRMANADEYEGVIQFLCSDAAKYVNGQNIIVDGGRSIW